jgi:hypothetical protein
VFWKADVMTISTIRLKIYTVAHFIFYDRVGFGDFLSDSLPARKVQVRS